MRAGAAINETKAGSPRNCSKNGLWAAHCKSTMRNCRQASNERNASARWPLSAAVAARAGGVGLVAETRARDRPPEVRRRVGGIEGQDALRLPSKRRIVAADQLNVSQNAVAESAQGRELAAGAGLCEGGFEVAERGQHLRVPQPRRGQPGLEL